MFSNNILKLLTKTYKYVPLQIKHMHSIACIPMPKYSSIIDNRELKLCIPAGLNLDICRGYAKSKDKGKDKKGKGGKVEISSSQMSNIVNLQEIKAEYQQHIVNLKADFVENLSIRSATGSIEALKIHFNNKDYELQELAQVVRKNPKTVILHMASFPQAIPVVLKAIAGSGLNLNPQQDGTSIFIPVPKVTKEHRENLAKNAKILYLKCRDGLKLVENEYLKKTRKAEISEDLMRSILKQIPAIAEPFQIEARQVFHQKVTELVGKD